MQGNPAADLCPPRAAQFRMELDEYLAPRSYQPVPRPRKVPLVIPPPECHANVGPVAGLGRQRPTQLTARLAASHLKSEIQRAMSIFKRLDHVSIGVSDFEAARRL